MPVAPGKVYLVGGGPGDPELLTVKAQRLLATADVVAYDDLLNPAVLAGVHPLAELIAVGYRGLRHGAKSGAPGDPVLSPVVIERALAGKTVVRLKCGDPLVFGRGGEEALELTRAGLDFEIVPGITAALGAAAYAGIPLTHRSLSGKVTLATGHLAGQLPSPTLGFSGQDTDHGTIVFYMPRHELSRHLATMVEKGVSAATPAAFVCAATTPAQQVIEGTVGDLAAKVAAFRTASPGLVIVGQTVALRAQIGWFKPIGVLAGKRILVARARPGESAIAAGLRRHGAEVIEAPLLQSWPLTTCPAFDRLLSSLTLESVLVFACATSVAAFTTRLKLLGMDPRSVPQCRLVTVGPQAAEALTAAGWSAWRQLPGSCDEAVAAAAPELGQAALTLLAGPGERPALVASFARCGLVLKVVPVYASRAVWPKVSAPPPDLVVLPSSSAAKALYSAGLGTPLEGVPTVAIGPQTAAAAATCGVTQLRLPARDEPQLVVELAVAWLTGAAGPSPVGSPRLNPNVVKESDRSSARAAVRAGLGPHAGSYEPAQAGHPYRLEAPS